MHGSPPAPSKAAPSAVAYALIQHSDPEAIFAFRAGRPVTAGAFLRDVAALAAVLPARQHVLNLCADRYRFAVGLAAALCREQVTLLPPNDMSGTLAALAGDFPDLYCLEDGRPGAPSLLAVAVPDEFVGAPSLSAIPVLPAGQPAVLLFTSGSTGRPKPAPKSWGTLARSAIAAGRRLGVDSLPSAVVVGTVPHQHSYGLESTVLLAFQHGLALQAERPFYSGDVVAALQSVERPRILVTTPIHIRALLAEGDAVPRADLIISATAPLTHDLAVEAEKRFSAPLIEIYGCSEAGQVATRRTALERGWHCLEGIALRQDKHGTWAAGPPVETETLLHDVIELSDSASFFLHGRSADLVNIGGKRSSLAHLDHQLTSIEGVLDGAFLMPDDSDRGITRLIAFAVAPGLSTDAILAALRARIDSIFLPRPLVLVDSLPRTNLGKLPRQALLQLASRSS